MASVLLSASRSAKFGHHAFPVCSESALSNRCKFRQFLEDLFEKLDDTKFNLVVIGQPGLPSGTSGAGDLLLTHAIPSDSANDPELDQACIPRPSFYLLRPDCYIGLCGTRLDPAAVTRYLADRFGIGSESRNPEPSLALARRSR